MSSSESDSGSSCRSDFEDISECEVEELFDNERSSQPAVSSRRGDEAAMEPYADEPLASVEWTEQYEKEMEETEVLEQELNDRFSGTTPTSEW